MAIKILTKLRDIVIPEKMEFKTQHFTISGNRTKADELFNPAFYQPILGSVEFELSTYNKFAFAFSVYEEEVNNLVLSNKRLAEKDAITRCISDELANLLFCLWFLRDTSVTRHVTFSDFVHSSALQIQANLMHYTKANGQINPQSFSIQDISEAYNMLNTIKRLCPSYNIIEKIQEKKKNAVISRNGIDPNAIDARDYSNYNRIERALLSLKHARAEPMLPLKIGFYMPIFECLFIEGSANEIQQKICERCAFYLETRADKRKHIYAKLKDGYTIRSKFLHGAALEKRHTNEFISDLAIEIDNITRQLLTKVIVEDSERFLDAENYSKFVGNIIFQE